MANLENRPDFEQISQQKPAKMTPGEIKQKLHEDDSEIDEVKPMSFPTEGKIPGAKKLDKVGLDKAEQFRLQDEIDKMQVEMEKQTEIISKLWARDQDQSKADKQKEKIKAKFEPRITELQNKLKEEFGEKENMETLMPQLKKQTEESDAKRAIKIKEGKEKIEDIGSRFQKIRVTPELKEAQKKAAQRDIEKAHAKLVKAEDDFAEAEKNRPGAFSRFFSRFKIGKQPEAVIAYQQAFQDKNISSEELKKLEAAAVEASASKPSAAEMAYQQAVRAVSEAKNQLEETKRSILNSGIYMERKKQEPGEKENKHFVIGMPGSGEGRLSVHGIMKKERPKAEVKKSEKPIARKPAPAIISGEHKIVFKEEPTQAKSKVEVNLPTEQEFEPEVVSKAEEQLKNYIKGMFFKGDNTKQLIFQNAALMNRLIDANFQGDQQTLNRTISDTKEEMLKTHKLSLEKQLKLEGAKFDDLAEGGKLATQLKAVFKKQPENYKQFLALEDLFEANATYKGASPKKPARPAPPVSRNW